MDIEQDLVVDQQSSSDHAPARTETNPVLNPSEADAPQRIGEQAQKPEQDAEAPPEKPELPKGVQRRIDRAVRDKYEAQARAKMLEERLASLEARVSAPQQQQRQEDVEPSIDKFDNFEQYVAAKAKWIAKQEIEATLSAREQREKAAREQEYHRTVSESWSKRVEQATAELPDFEDVLASSDMPLTPAMEITIKESEVGPKLAYYLATHPEEGRKIAGLSPASQIRELGKIEAKLEQPAQTKRTNAPPPLKDIRGTASAKKDPGKMSDAEYAKWRKSWKAA